MRANSSDVNFREFVMDSHSLSRTSCRSIADTPQRFEWGYAGSGPAQLALALLADCFGDDEAAVEWHQDFKSAVVAGLPLAGWILTEQEIQETL